MNWIYDERTDYSRLVVGYDAYGITIREWHEADEAEGFEYREGFYTWGEYRKRDRSYYADNGEGRMKTRLVAGAISLIGNIGTSSDNAGLVEDLDTDYSMGRTYRW